MKRQDELNEAWCKYMNKCSTEIMQALAFALRWCDSHPHWISIEDELPPRWETNPNVSDTVITYGFLGDTHPIVELNHYHFGDKRWFYSQATHWMPFEHPKKGGKA